MGPHSQISIASIVYSSQRCCTSCVGSNVTVTSYPAPSRRPHSMLNLPGVILIEKME